MKSLLKWIKVSGFAVGWAPTSSSYYKFEDGGYVPKFTYKRGDSKLKRVKLDFKVVIPSKTVQGWFDDPEVEVETMSEEEFEIERISLVF